MSNRISFDIGDAAELIDLFEFFCDWFDYDRTVLERSVVNFTGGTRLGDVRDDLLRLADQLGTSPMIRAPQ